MTGRGLKRQALNRHQTKAVKRFEPPRRFGGSNINRRRPTVHLLRRASWNRRGIVQVRRYGYEPPCPIIIIIIIIIISYNTVGIISTIKSTSTNIMITIIKIMGDEMMPGRAWPGIGTHQDRNCAN